MVARRCPISSTNRGGLRSEADNYATPAWAIKRLLDVYQPWGRVWMEPAAGDGVIIRTVNEVAPELKWIACELREECRPGLLHTLVDPRRVIITDFIQKPPAIPLGKQVDVVITNPPYRLAQEFIETSFRYAPVVLMLLRLNFLGSDDRAGFLRKYPPDVFVLPNRPSFKGNGKTDSPEYAWFRFFPRMERTHGSVQVLPSTPAEERGLRGRVRKTPTVSGENA